MRELSVLELTDAQTEAQLKSKTSLVGVYNEWCKRKANRMDDVRNVIEARANALVRPEKEKDQREER